MRLSSYIVASIFLAGWAITTTVSAQTVAYYRFEEGTAGQAATGTVLDSSGNNLNGQALNDPDYSSDVPVSTIPQTGAKDNLSLQFSATNSERVLMPDNYPQLELTQSLTLEAYFNVFGIPNAAGSILLRGDARSGLDPYFMNVEPGLIRFAVTNASNQTALVTAPLPGLDQWIFVAGTLDNATGNMDLYVNGKLANSITTNIRPFATLDPTQDPGLAIGGVPPASFGDFQTFDGLIDEVRISNVALSPSQFLDAPSVPEPASLSLLALFSFGLVARRRRA